MSSVMMRRRKSQWLMAAAMCGFWGIGPRASSNSPPNAPDFYIVSVGFSDALPGWHHSVLEVSPEGGDVLVRYIRVSPSSAYCGEATKIAATTVRLPKTSLTTITGGLNLCAIDPQELSRTIKAFPKTQGSGAFAGDRFAIVANCGSDTKVIRLPGDWEVDLARMKRKRPGIAALWTLQKTVGTWAFGAFPSIDVVPPEMAARFQPAGEGIVAELKSGRFDAGFAPRPFQDDVAALRPVSDVPEFLAKLANADHFRFDRYVTPQYPPLAMQVRISGTVELELTSNPNTGETEQVTVISGNPILALVAKESAQQWRFLPGADTALHSTPVVLEFIFRCP
jgi:hypothetical protein